MNAATSPSLAGWVARDAAIFGVLAAICYVVAGLLAAESSWLLKIPAGLLGFVAAYAICYIVHEWGHLIGATLAGARVPLGPYRGVLLPLFDVTRHSRAQFLALSVGGVAGYCSVAALAVFTYSNFPGSVTRGLLLGGLAFVVQSLSVDGPIIVKVLRGADIRTASTAGTRPELILRRTWQSWGVLGLLIVVYVFAG